MSYYVFPASRGTSIGSGNTNLFTSPPLVSPPLTHSVALGSRYGQSASAKARYEQLGWEEVTPPSHARRQHKGGNGDSTGGGEISIGTTVTSSGGLSNLISAQRNFPIGFGFNVGNGKPSTSASSHQHRSQARKLGTSADGGVGATPTCSTTNSNARPQLLASSSPAATTKEPSPSKGISASSGNESFADQNGTRSVLAELLAQEELRREMSKEHTQRSPSKAKHSDPQPPTERSLQFELAANEEDSSSRQPYSKRNSSDLATPKASGARKGPVGFEKVKYSVAAAATENNNNSNVSTTSQNNKGRGAGKDDLEGPISPSASPASPNTTNPQAALLAPYFNQILIDQCASTTLQRQQQQQQQHLQRANTGRDAKVGGQPNAANTLSINASYVAAIGGGSSVGGTPHGSSGVMATPKRYRLRGSGLDAAPTNGSFPSSVITSRMASRLDTPTPTNEDGNRLQGSATKGTPNGSKQQANRTSGMSSRPPTGGHNAQNNKGHNNSVSSNGNGGRTTPSSSTQIEGTTGNTSMGDAPLVNIASVTAPSSKPGSLLLKFHLNRKEMAAKTSLITNQPIDGSGGRVQQKGATTQETSESERGDIIGKNSRTTPPTPTSAHEPTSSAYPGLGKAPLVPQTGGKPVTPTTPSQPSLYIASGRNGSNLSNTSAQAWERATAYGSRAGSLLQSPPKGARNVWDEVFEME